MRSRSIVDQTKQNMKVSFCFGYTVPNLALRPVNQASNITKIILKKIYSMQITILKQSLVGQFSQYYVYFITIQA